MKKNISFVEILSPCPVNWKMTAVEARRWLENNLEPVFPVGNLRDLPKGPFDQVDKKKVRVSDRKILEILGVGEEEVHAGTVQLKEEQNFKIAGFGGQGVLSTGILLANCAIAEVSVFRDCAGKKLFHDRHQPPQLRQQIFRLARSR